MFIFNQKLELWGGFVRTKLVTVINQSKLEGRRGTHDQLSTLASAGKFACAKS